MGKQVNRLASIEEKHCSYCKYYYCYNASMFCSHPSKCHKITAKRKHGCNFFEKGTNSMW